MAPESRRRDFLVCDVPCSLASIVVQLAPSDHAAIEQGRIFVNQQRIRDPLYSVQPGARVTWYAPRIGDAGDLAFSILARRGDWVVAAKPAAWSCEPDRTGVTTSLRDAVADELRASSVHVLTRLDVGVSGLVLIGLSHRACRVAMELQNAHRIGKDYFALVSGRPPASVTWNGPPCSNREAKTEVRVLSEPRPIGAAAQKGGAISLLSVKPITGRKHQIRIHAAHYGYPLLGDTRYGGLTRLSGADGRVLPVRRVMLHAYRMIIPWEKQEWITTCAPPRDLAALWITLGGSAAHLQIE